ncbi:MAG: HAD family hydrolase, partial [Bacteroidales bacterium]|nr:HAD family hydrolase [Bacteroidales bacterium]
NDYGTEENFYQALFQTMVEVKSSLTPEKARAWYNEKYMPLQVAILAMYFTARPLASELLEAMRQQQLKLVLYSDYGCAYEKLQAIGIDPALFDYVISAPELGGLKPSRASMQRLIEKCGLNPAETLFVGDRQDTDGESAQAVGMEFYNVKSDKNAWDELLKCYI